ncbi:MAG: hypothetical protein AB1722_04000 [Pseudomonadota bacterium]
MSRRLLFSLLLAFSLLFVQQGAALHSLSHLLAEQQQDHSLPHDPQCELCAAYAQIGSAIGSTAIAFDLTDAPSAPRVASLHSLPTTLCAAFAARAPPRSA